MRSVPRDITITKELSIIFTATNSFHNKCLGFLHIIPNGLKSSAFLIEGFYGCMLLTFSSRSLISHCSINNHLFVVIMTATYTRKVWEKHFLYPCFE